MLKIMLLNFFWKKPWYYTRITVYEKCMIVFDCEKYDWFVVLLRIPSSRLSPRTFPQFVRVQVLGFLAAENDGFET